MTAKSLGAANRLCAEPSPDFGTTIGGMLHTFPFLISDLHLALRIAYGIVVFELLAIALIRYRFMKTPLLNTVVQVIIGGGIVFAVGLWLGKFGG